MHHTPAAALGRGQTDDIGLKRTSHYAWRRILASSVLLVRATCIVVLALAPVAKAAAAGVTLGSVRTVAEVFPIRAVRRDGLIGVAGPMQ